jgi:hypothetical protein
MNAGASGAGQRRTAIFLSMRNGFGANIAGNSCNYAQPKSSLSALNIADDRVQCYLVQGSSSRPKPILEKKK